MNGGNIVADREKTEDQLLSELSELRRKVTDLEARCADNEANERALRRSEERLLSLAEHLPRGVCLLDKDWRVVFTNPIGKQDLAELTNIGEGDVISHLGVYPIEDLRDAAAKGSSNKIVVEGPPIRVFELDIEPVKEGRDGWVLMIRDVTEEQEVQVRAQLQDRLAAVGQLAAGIAHDFNNTLTVIIGYGELLDMLPDVPDSLKGKLKTIVKYGRRAEQMIGQILDFSRQTTAKQSAIDLAPFLKEAVKLLTRTLPENIKVTADFGKGDYIVKANIAQLQEVVTNLAVNGRDAMRDGGRLGIGLSKFHLGVGEKLHLKTSNSEIVPKLGAGEWVVLSVSDTGTGIPPEILSRIYEPFFSTKKRGEGTGLGMSQVYGIVKQHGGYIDIDTTEGKGTTFLIYLRLVREKAAPLEEVEQGFPEGQGETILLVEDEESVREVIQGMLEPLNYRVIAAIDGREALDVLDSESENVAVVLTDLVMPEMGGEELILKLREQGNSVPVVVMTGYQMKKETELDSKIQGYLRKPLGILKLAQAIRGALKRQKK